MLDIAHVRLADAQCLRHFTLPDPADRPHQPDVSADFLQIAFVIHTAPAPVF